MKRIILDTQSNRHFRGVPLEQMYDQRGGPCQLDDTGIVITTEPIDPEWLEYWQGLGFTLPQFSLPGRLILITPCPSSCFAIPLCRIKFALRSMENRAGWSFSALRRVSGAWLKH